MISAVQLVAGNQTIVKMPCKTRLQNIRRDIWDPWAKHLKHISGWGCDAQGLPIAENEEEADKHFVDAYPQCALFRRHLPEHHDLLESIFTRPSASGDYAISRASSIMSSIEASPGLEASPTPSSASSLYKSSLLKRASESQRCLKKASTSICGGRRGQGR